MLFQKIGCFYLNDQLPFEPKGYKIVSSTSILLCYPIEVDKSSLCDRQNIKKREDNVKEE
jgi:hypothetical protein